MKILERKWMSSMKKLSLILFSLIILLNPISIKEKSEELAKVISGENPEEWRKNN